MGKRLRNEQKKIYIYIFFRGSEAPSSSKQRIARGDLSKTPASTLHTREREEERAGGRRTASRGRRTTVAAHRLVGPRPTYALSQGERERGRAREGRKGGNTTGLQPSADGASKPGEPATVVLCSSSHQKH